MVYNEQQMREKMFPSGYVTFANSLIMTVKRFGYLLVNIVRFLRFYFSVLSLVLVSIEKKY